MAQRSLEIGGSPTDRVRSLNDVVERTLALGAAVAKAFGAPADELSSWLQETGLDSALTPSEREWIGAEVHTEAQELHMSWQSERLVVLLWALGFIAQLPAPAEQCSTGVLEDLLPPYGDLSLEQFRASALLRPEDQLFDLAFEMQEHHVVARQRKRNPGYRPASEAVDVEVVQERHHAINWLVGYCGQSWDEVTTDT